METFGLPEHTLKTMRGIFAHYPQVEKVVVYGSRAVGNYKTSSDIDLTMYGKYTDSITYQDLLRISGELDDSDIPYLVDLSVFDDLDHAKLHEHIERVGKVFYEKEVLSWELKRLEDLCIFTRGLTYSKKDEVEESNNRVLRATNIDLETHTLKFDEIRFISDKINIKQEKKVMQNDILICTASGSKSHLGKVALVDSPIDFAFGGFMAIIRANEEVLPQYLFKNLISQNFKSHIARLSDGANINNLKFDLIRDFPIPIPPLPVQKQIVEKLDAAFADIDKAISATQKNIENAKALFASHMQSTFTEMANTSRKVPLDEVCIVERGSSPRPIKKFLTDNHNGVNWIKIGDIAEGDKYVVSTKQKITAEGSKKSRYVKKGELILTNSMSYGRPYIMAIDGYIHDGWFVLRLNEGLEENYFYYLLSSPLVQQQFHNLAAGSVVKNISGDLLKKTMLIVPPMEEQRRVVTQFEQVSAEVKRLKGSYIEKNKNLFALKSSILNQAFSGELTKDAA